MGLPLGQLTRGDLTRQEAGLGPQAGNRFIPIKRHRYDAYGNTIGIMDANGNLLTVDYDAKMHSFPVTERRHFADGHTLTFAASYHYGFGKAMSATDYNGNVHLFAYDTFGRISKIVKPGDTLDRPTQHFTYYDGSPRSWIKTEQRERSGEDDVFTSITYMDGLGRKLQTRSDAENGQVLVSEATVFDARQGVSTGYLPYFADSLDYAAPDPAQAHTTQYYDPMQRVIRADNPDGSYMSIVYKPLAKVIYSEEDNSPQSPAYNTPKTLTFDAWERLIRVDEINVVDGQTETYTTRYAYDLAGNLTQVIDAQGNTKLMEYDLLSRRLRMVDPDKGETRYTYDDAGNVISVRDAKGQEIHYTYDAANRLLTERWVYGNGRADVINAVYHYDGDLSPLHTNAENTAGRVSYVEDQSGTSVYSYDARGNTTGTAHHFADSGLVLVAQSEYDDMDRLTRAIYADGSSIRYEYNARGQLARVPGFVDQIEYTPSGERQSVRYANGMETTYEYDARLRLVGLTATNGGTILQDLHYSFDAAGNIFSIVDGRPQRKAANDQSQTFSYDGLNRLLRAQGTYGQIDYGYDSIGNLVSKSSTAAEPALNLGVMRYGENGAGPHALTSAGGVDYLYDANGNLVRKGDTVYQWNVLNQLVSVDDGEMLSSYVYNASGQRVVQTVRQGEQVDRSLYLGDSIELRGDEMVFYIYDDESRIARITMPLQAERLLSDFNAVASTTPPASVERHWYVADHLGGTSLLLDESGQVTAEVVYYPYGLTRYEQNGEEVRFRFTDKELDATGLYYFEARYYDPVTGRFISVDPLYVEQAQAGQIAPQNLNLYAYTLNNPLRYTDPNGTDAAAEDEAARKATEKGIEFVEKAFDSPNTQGLKKAFGTLGGVLSMESGIRTLFDSNASSGEKLEAAHGVISGAATVGEAVATAAASSSASLGLADALVVGFEAGGMLATAFSPAVIYGKLMSDAYEGARIHNQTAGAIDGSAKGVMAALLDLPLDVAFNEYAYKSADNKYQVIRARAHNQAFVKAYNATAQASQATKQAALRRIGRAIPAERKSNTFYRGRYSNDLDFAIFEGARAIRKNPAILK